nr:4-(cytidine 5'-diphospho)-2-C-methyl-D-erythritol kinase [uncultured Peptostreptococcus sp.]
MESIRLKAMGKINLSIDIKGILDDGYHDVEMVMQSVNLSDKLLIRKSEEGFSMKCSNADVPVGKKNIIYKTWMIMKNKYKIDGGIEVFLEKNIPIAAGMAGGSANSAAIFVGINKLFELGLDDENLIDLSKELGSDIAFCIKGGTYLATGRGTDLVKLDDLDFDIEVLVCRPNVFVSTKKVYKKFDTMYEKNNNIERPDNQNLIRAIKDKNMDDLVASMCNVLEPVTRQGCSDIARIEKIMLQEGADKAMMSGSGPTVFAFFSDKKKAKKCANILRKQYLQTHLTSISNKGVDIYGNK